MTDLRNQLQSTLADAYTLDRELGAGGMAVVFLAHDLKHNRHVALKVLRSEVGAAIGRDRFLREVVVTAYAHDRGIVHRDVKPENILLTPQGQALVADFGIAAAPDSSSERLTATGVGLGTPSYMSPEQVLGERTVQPQADVYAMAVVLYEMLAGHRPFTDGAPTTMLARRFTEGAPSVATVRPDVPRSLAALVQRSLEVDPTRRPATATVYAALLEDVVTSSPLAAAAPPAWSKIARRFSVARLAVVDVAVAVVAGVFALSRSESGRDTSIAILPFANRTGDTAQTYLSDGLAEDLTASLARIPELRVVPHGTVRRYRDDARPPEVQAPVLRDSLAYNYYLLAQHHYHRFAPTELARSIAYYGCRREPDYRQVRAKHAA